jgi:excinuclease UvrABC ATPase subunit
MACPRCKISFPELTPQGFSFNSPQGMCGDCNGLGTRIQIDPDRLVPDPELSIDQGAIAPWGPDASEKTGWAHGFRGQLCGCRHRYQAALQETDRRNARRCSTAPESKSTESPGRARVGAGTSSWRGKVWCIA